MSSISKINLYCQKLKLAPPHFAVLQREGEDHHPMFKVSCTFEENIEIGEGPALKVAREEAALKIVELLGIDLKLKEWEDNVSYAIESYNAPLVDIWESGPGKEYTLTLRRKEKNQYEYKNFKVQITQIIE